MDADKLATARARRKRSESPVKTAKALGVSRPRYTSAWPRASKASWPCHAVSFRHGAADPRSLVQDREAHDGLSDLVRGAMQDTDPLSGDAR